MLDSGLPLVIGANPGKNNTTTHHFKGMIDDVRIYKGLLDFEEIKDLSQFDITTHQWLINGKLSQDRFHNYEESTLHLISADKQKQALPLESLDKGDQAVLASWTAKKGMDPDGSYPRYPHHHAYIRYSFENTLQNAIDSTHIRADHGPTYVPGLIGTAISLNENGKTKQNLWTHGKYFTDSRRNNISIALWVKSNTKPSTPAPLFTNKGLVTPAQDGFFLGVAPNGGWYLNMGAKEKDKSLDFTGKADQLTDGKWHHLGFTMENGSELKVYLDGKIVATEQIAGARWYRYATFHSGSDFAAYDKRCYFSGQLDELTLYYKTLSDEEMARMAQKP